ncbi:hypothetical protein LCGC14_2912940, partial [marine sediment metagenome]
MTPLHIFSVNASKKRADIVAGFRVVKEFSKHLKPGGGCLCGLLRHTDNLDFLANVDLAALDPPGYDLRGVLVGSEGTLGIVTEMVLRILPLVESVVTLLVVYDDVADAARSVSDIIAAGIVPATLEMMDATVIRAVEESKPCGYPLDAAAVLIAEVDGPAAGLARQADEIAELCRKNQCREVRKAKD